MPVPELDGPVVAVAAADWPVRLRGQFGERDARLAASSAYAAGGEQRRDGHRLPLAAPELFDQPVDGLRGRRELGPVVMQKHDRAGTDRGHRPGEDRLSSWLLEVTWIYVPQHGLQTVAGGGELQPPTREAERGTEQPWPDPADRCDDVRGMRRRARPRNGAIAVVAMTPPVNTDLMTFACRALEQPLATCDPLAENVERRARSMTAQHVEDGARDGPRTVVERQGNRRRASRPVTDGAQHDARIAHAGATVGATPPNTGAAVTGCHPLGGFRALVRRLDAARRWDRAPARQRARRDLVVAQPHAHGDE